MSHISLRSHIRLILLVEHMTPVEIQDLKNYCYGWGRSDSSFRVLKKQPSKLYAIKHVLNPWTQTHMETCVTALHSLIILCPSEKEARYRGKKLEEKFGCGYKIEQWTAKEKAVS